MNIGDRRHIKDWKRTHKFAHYKGVLKWKLDFTLCTGSKWLSDRDDFLYYNSINLK
jgi:hypothetical protein